MLGQLPEVRSTIENSRRTTINYEETFNHVKTGVKATVTAPVTAPRKLETIVEQIIIANKAAAPVAPMNYFAIPAMPREVLTLDIIVRIVCRHMGIAPEELSSKSRKTHLVDTRCAIAWFAKKYIPATNLKPIGKAMGGRHHSTVIHSIDRVNNLIEIKDFEYIQLLSQLEALIKTHLRTPLK
jgi:DnaA-like protein